MDKIRWNGGFIYYPYDKQEEAKAITLPHDAMIYEKRDENCDNLYNSGYYPGGKYVYEKKFYVENDELCRIIEFEGIYRNSEVYLNDELIGGHKYGFSQFQIDITDRVIRGSENLLKIVVDNSDCPNNRWYSGSGIYRDVNLFVGEKTHINPYGIVVKTNKIRPSLDNIYIEQAEGLKAYISVEVDIENQDDEELICFVDILDQGKVVAKGILGEELIIENPKLWSTEHPNLYNCYVYIVRAGRIIDKEEDTFGIRIVECNANDGLIINKQKVFLNGGCIHHDNGILGAAAYEDAERRKVRLIKEAGFNAIRCAHNPFSRSLLKACDEIGLYVMEEAFDQWLMHKTTYDYATDFRECYEDDLKRMVKKDINHPSVIIYSIGNEIADTASPRAGELAEHMVDIIHSMDETKLITHCVNSASVLAVATTNNSIDEVDDKVENAAGMNLILESPMGNTIVDLTDKIMPFLIKLPSSDKRTNHVYNKIDIAGMNYGKGGEEYFHRKYPNRVFCATETYPHDIIYNYPLGQNKGYQIGDFVWTAWEYIGEASGGVYTYGDGETSLYKKYPALLGGYGHIDITGFLTSQVYFRQIVCGLRTAPFISVRPMNCPINRTHKSLWRLDDGFSSWSWAGYEGYDAVVNVFATGSRVALYLDDNLLGEKDIKKYKVTFNIKYKPGELKAISYDRLGNEIGRMSLTSGDDDLQLAAEVEEKNLVASNQSLAHINITIQDDNGIVNMTSDTLVNVSVEGPGVLMGVASGNPITADEFATDSCHTYYGRALAIVRSTGEPGVVRVKINAEGYESVVREICYE